METKLTMEYDATGDILYLNKRAPYPAQESTELDYGIVARLNPDTAEIESLEILFFTQRLKTGEVFHLPILAEFRLSEAV